MLASRHPRTIAGAVLLAPAFPETQHDTFAALIRLAPRLVHGWETMEELRIAFGPAMGSVPESVWRGTPTVVKKEVTKALANDVASAVRKLLEIERTGSATVQRLG